MFKLAIVKTVKWPVTVNVPADGGVVNKQTFSATFKVLAQKELDAQIAKDRNETGDKDLLTEVLTGFDNVHGEDGSVAEYSDDTKAALIDIPYVRIALVRAYFSAIAGDVAQRKNS